MRILVAIDGSQCSQAAMQALKTQFRAENTDIHVLHAIDWPHLFPDSFSFAAGPEFAGEFQLFVDRERGKAHQLADAAAASFRDAGFQASCVVMECDPKKAILDYAARWNPDLIVVGSHGRRGIDRVVLGSVSEAVARHAHCSVQIMRSAA